MHIYKLCLTYRQNLWQCTLKNDMQFTKKNQSALKTKVNAILPNKKQKQKTKGVLKIH